MNVKKDCFLCNNRAKVYQYYWNIWYYGQRRCIHDFARKGKNDNKVNRRHKFTARYFRSCKKELNRSRWRYLKNARIGVVIIKKKHVVLVKYSMDLYINDKYKKRQVMYNLDYFSSIATSKNKLIFFQFFRTKFSLVIYDDRSFDFRQWIMQLRYPIFGKIT